MIRIPKKDAFAMRNLCGMQSICKSRNKHHASYYIVENPDYLRIYQSVLGGVVSNKGI